MPSVFDKFDITTKCCVARYCRDITTILKKSKYYLFHNCPKLVILICMKYHHIPEHFGVIGNNILISKSKKQINSKTNCNVHNTSFGSKQIKSKSNIIHKWTLKIHGLPRRYNTFCIGITSNDNDPEIPLNSTRRKGYKYYYED